MTKYYKISGDQLAYLLRAERELACLERGGVEDWELWPYTDSPTPEQIQNLLEKFVEID